MAMSLWPCSLLITPPARRAWRSYKFAAFFLFFLVSKVGLPHMGHTAVHNLLSEPSSPRLLNSISSQLCHQNTQFNMYTTTSKQQEGTKCKDSCPKCFITTNFDKFHREGAINRGEIFEIVFRHFPQCFHLELYTSIKQQIKLMFYVLKYRNKTHYLTCK